MEAKNLPSKLLKCAIVLSVATIFSSCSKDSDLINPDTTQSSKDGSLYKQLLKSNFKKEDIRDMGDYFLVENDIVFSKTLEYDILSSIKLQHNNGLITDESGVLKSSITQNQYSTNSLVSFVVQPMIAVAIDKSMPAKGSGADDWHTEIEQAIQHWNSVINSRVNFVLVPVGTPDTHITIFPDGDTLDYRVIAAADFPQKNGQPGPRIRVNLDFLNNVTVSSGQKIYNIVHELGHCIGFRHSNWQSSGESVDSNKNLGANLVPGTVTNDQYSVMNGGTALNSWSGFSNYDKIALSGLYPEDYAAERVFDLKLFKIMNPDVDQAYGGNPVQIISHWKNTGINEGRVANAVFNSKFYLKKNTDVAQKFGAANYKGALNHWFQDGINQGRQGSLVFNVKYYLQNNPDIRNNYGANNYQGAMHHWLIQGVKEGRKASPDFDVRVYLKKYQDIKNAFGTDYAGATYHYLTQGIKEGRTAIPI